MKANGEKKTRTASQKRPSSGTHFRQRPGRIALALLKEWKRLALPVEDERVIVAVSGGADSVALLLLLDELLKAKRLAVRLTVAHLDHGLRGALSAEDARWVGSLAEELGFEFELGRVRVKERAARARDNLEQAARRARYEFLKEVANKCGARFVITAHTMDDQAETVLMRLLRGSGVDGLGGMESVRVLSEDSVILLARPLLGWARRLWTEKYCRERKVEVRVDAMNEDERFARVRVRRRLLPLLESFNPKVVESLSRASALMREDSSLLNAEAEELLEAASEGVEAEAEKSASGACSLSVNILRSAPLALRRRALRLWLRRGRGDLRRLELVHLAGVEKLIEGERGGRVVELPGGFVEHRRGKLHLHVKNSPQRHRGAEKA